MTWSDSRCIGSMSATLLPKVHLFLAMAMVPLFPSLQWFLCNSGLSLHLPIQWTQPNSFSLSLSLFLIGTGKTVFGGDLLHLDTLRIERGWRGCFLPLRTLLSRFLGSFITIRDLATAIVNQPHDSTLVCIYSLGLFVDLSSFSLGENKHYLSLHLSSLACNCHSLCLFLHVHFVTFSSRLQSTLEHVEAAPLLLLSLFSTCQWFESVIPLGEEQANYLLLRLGPQQQFLAFLPSPSFVCPFFLLSFPSLPPRWRSSSPFHLWP